MLARAEAPLRHARRRGVSYRCSHRSLRAGWQMQLPACFDPDRQAQYAEPVNASFIASNNGGLARLVS